MSTGNTFQHGSFSASRLRRISKVQFGVWSPDEIRSSSVTKAHRENGLSVVDGVTKYEVMANGRPNYGGVNDPRMGTTENKIRCKTCDGTYSGSATGEKKNDCPGHFGHIDLAKPVYHVGFIKEVRGWWWRLWRGRPRARSSGRAARAWAFQGSGQSARVSTYRGLRPPPPPLTPLSSIVSPRSSSLRFVACATTARGSWSTRYGV